ncbi:unnamed protein product [Heterobilharzia americana]|nr:unnamed protein product [Heterobilharzia americana]
MTSISGFRSATLFAGKKSKSYTMYGKNISSKYLSPSSSSRSTYTTTTTNRNGVVYRTENLDVILLRALTFQMLKIGFDVGEIQQETRDELRNLLEELRYPSMLCMGFNSAPLGLVLSRTNSMMDNINILSSIHSNFPNNSVGNTKEYISSGMMRMRHLKGKTNRNVTLNDSNYSALMNRDRRYLKFRRTYVTNNPSALTIKVSNRCNQINYITSSPFPNNMYIEEAAANLASAIKSFLSPPTLSASSSAATVIDPNLIRLITDSSGYLDMARFGINVSGNTANTMVTIAAATSQINYSRVINDCTGSLNRSTYGAGSSVGSRMYCAAHLVAFNVHHTLVKSYPSLFIVPQGISQNCLIKVARSHKRGRFPVVTWQHPETGAYLLRGSEIQSNVILNTFKNIKTSSKSNAGDYVDDGVDSSFSHATASKEHIRYIRALVDMSLSAINSSRPSSVITSETGYSAADDLSNSSQLPTNPIKTADSVTISSPDYVSRERRQIPDKISPTISHVNNNKTRSLGRIGMFAARRRLARSGLSPMGSIASGLDEDLISMDSASQNSNPPNNSRQSIYDTNSVGVPGPIPSGISYSNRPISLYILCEKQMTKMSKIFNSSSVLLSPIDYPSVSSVNKCFKGFFKACLPNDSNRSKTSTKILSAAANTAGIPLDHTSGGGNATNMHSNSGTMAASHFNHNHSQSNNTNSGIVNGEQTETENITTSLTTNTTTAKLLNVFIEAHENGWFTQLKSLLELAGTVVDLLDLQGASVALCLENGSDVVAQTVSLVQVMLDPYYRTIAGFWSLIDKEWLIFGHTFNQNLNQTLSTKSGSISPIFLQFLDAVHQLLRQFPLAFEFNDYYLRFLAYHHVSNRFHNFKYDSELEKFTAWFPDLVESLANNYKLGTSIVSNIDEHLLELYRSRSIWPFIQQQHYEWPVFFNFRYSRTLGEKVLRPATNLASLDLWQFYLTEDLAFGPIYDLDHFSPSYRKHTNRPYEPVLRQGFNNSHIEQTYAVLGLREGEEAIGWQEAWEQAQSEILNPYSQLSPTHKRVNRPHDKPYINNIQPITNSTGTISTATVTANIVSSINTTTTVTSDTNNKTNHAKAVNKFVPLLSRFTTYRESSEPTESVLHRKLIESEYSLARRRAISSNVLDANQTKKSLQSSGTSSSGYPPKHPGVVVDDDDDDDVTQTTTLTPQGGTVSDAIDLDGDLLWYSENNTINSMPVTTSELNLNDTPQPRVIIVKDSSVERDDQSQLNGDMSTTSTTSTTITVKAIKDFSNLHFKKNGNESKQQITGTGADSGGGGVYNTNHQQIPACEPISEDEAFHEDNEDIYGDRYNSIEESSIDDYNFTRHAILEYHRTATLKRLTRRTGSGASSNVVAGGGGVCNTVPNSQSHPIHDRTLDNGLTPGGHQSITIEYESGSITSIGCDPGGASITPVKSAGLPLQNELQMHKFTSSQADTNISCELCHQKCQSTDNLVKCIECDLLCHEKCSTLDSKCLPTSIINTCNQTKKLGNILKRHDSAYLPSETDNRKSNQLDERGRSTPAFGGGSGGGGSGLFSPTLPWRVERDQSIRSSMILIQDNRGGKRKLSESSSSPGQINTLPDTTQSQGARSLSGAELPKHLASSSYYGYLYKLSHRKFLQQWKQRLFALDTNRHQLKYYESYAESLPRGCIDLQDVRNVKIMKNFTYQRKSLAIVVFELETNNRTYRLGAANQESAMQWIERIQKAIQ